MTMRSGPTNSPPATPEPYETIESRLGEGVPYHPMGEPVSGPKAGAPYHAAEAGFAHLAAVPYTPGQGAESEVLAGVHYVPGSSESSEGILYSPGPKGVD